MAKYTVEHYFGASNYFNDPYLQSSLGEDNWVTIRVINEFKKMQKLQLTNEEVFKALAGSHIVETKKDLKYNDFYIRRKEKQPK